MPHASRADGVALHLIVEGWAGRPLPEWQLLTDAAFSVELARGEHLFLPGDVHPYAYILRRGLLKTHTDPSSPRDSTFGFIVEQGFVASIPALKSEGIDRLLALGMDAGSGGLGRISGGRADASISAIEPSDLVGVEVGVLNDLCRRHEEWADLVATTLAVQLIEVAREASLLRELTAQERYRLFVHARPSLAARLPQRELARYLGITEAAMSRLVKRTRATMGAEQGA